MLELRERLRRLAERGTPRGAETVWRSAQELLEAPVEAIVLADRPRRRRFWSVVASATVVVALVAGLLVSFRSGETKRPRIATQEALPTGSITAGRWTQVPKSAAGLGVGTVFDSLVSTGKSVLLGGGRPTGRFTGIPLIWRSPDGLRWNEATTPTTTGFVSVVAAHGNIALAIGGTGATGSSNFVWRSEDDGRSWRVVASAADLFGTPEPISERPAVLGLTYFRGIWIAYGAGGDGYEAIWTSADGTKWQQVLDTRAAGSATVVPDDKGGLFAYWVTLGWFSTDPTRWRQPEMLSVPGRLYLASVAPGAAVAIGENLDRTDVPKPLLRSSDGGHKWVEDRRFLQEFPNASTWSINRVGRLLVAAGTSGTPNHPDAWVSRDARGWQAMPDALHGATGGSLSLVAGLNGRIVMVGTPPELDRYYLFNG